MAWNASLEGGDKAMTWMWPLLVSSPGVEHLVGTSDMAATRGAVEVTLWCAFAYVVSVEEVAIPVEDDDGIRSICSQSELHASVRQSQFRTQPCH